MSANELARKRNENIREYEAIINSCKYEPFELTLKSKVEIWNEEKRLRLSIVKASKVVRGDPVRTARLQREIDDLHFVL